jgi:hypothetical protein
MLSSPGHYSRVCSDVLTKSRRLSDSWATLFCSLLGRIEGHIYANEDTALGFPLQGVAELFPASTDRLSLPVSSSSDVARAAVSASVVKPPGPELHAFTVVDLTWSSEAGRVYEVQWTPSLNQPHWENVGPHVTGTGTVLSVFGSTRRYPHGFYRLQVAQYPP